MSAEPMVQEVQTREPVTEEKHARPERKVYVEFLLLGPFMLSLLPIRWVSTEIRRPCGLQEPDIDRQLPGHGLPVGGAPPHPARGHHLAQRAG